MHTVIEGSHQEIKQNKLQATIKEPHEVDTRQATIEEPQEVCIGEPHEENLTQPAWEEPQHEEVKQNDATLDDVDLDVDLSAAIEWLDVQWETLGPITDPQHPPARKTRLPPV